MFGNPVAVEEEEAVFYLVWTYGIKTFDRRKKARCIFDESLRSGSVKVLIKHTQAAVIKPVLDCFMVSQPVKTSLFLEPMCLTRLLKLLSLKRVSISNQTKHSMIGG
jgi:hypothetical protein